MIAAHIIIDGIVQGVGFRWFALNLANRCGLVGWVRNRWRGDVEIFVEGEREVIDEFLEALRQGPKYGRINDIEIKWKEASGKFKIFNIAR